MQRSPPLTLILQPSRHASSQELLGSQGLSRDQGQPGGTVGKGGAELQQSASHGELGTAAWQPPKTHLQPPLTACRHPASLKGAWPVAGKKVTWAAAWALPCGCTPNQDKHAEHTPITHGVNCVLPNGENPFYFCTITHKYNSTNMHKCEEYFFRPVFLQHSARFSLSWQHPQ